MISVGLTGNIGSGKSTVARLFQILNVPVYQADSRAGLLMNQPEMIRKICNLFGNGILDAAGHPDKKKIAGIVFSDSERLHKLNSIIHPAVLSEYHTWKEQQKNVPYVIMESAILFETGYAELFDKIIFVSASEKLRIQRVVARDHASQEEVMQRIKSQLPEKKKKDKADFVVMNNETRPLIPQILKIHLQMNLL